MGLMDSQWSDLCRMLSDAECKKTNTNNAWKPSLCNVLNFCVCGGLGEQSFHFQQNLVQLLRPFLRIPIERKKQKTAEQCQNKDKSKAELRREKKTPARKMAEDGFLVLHFQLNDGDVETMHLANPSSASGAALQHCLCTGGLPWLKLSHRPNLVSQMIFFLPWICKLFVICFCWT